MTTIILDDEQVKALKASHGAELRDQTGNLLGRVWTPEDENDLRIIKDRLTRSEPKYTTSEVLEHLRSLDQP